MDSPLWLYLKDWNFQGQFNFNSSYFFTVLFFFYGREAGRKYWIIEYATGSRKGNLFDLLRYILPRRFNRIFRDDAEGIPNRVCLTKGIKKDNSIEVAGSFGKASFMNVNLLAGWRVDLFMDIWILCIEQNWMKNPIRWNVFLWINNVLINF